jgi:hypothetical protein
LRRQIGAHSKGLSCWKLSWDCIRILPCVHIVPSVRVGHTNKLEVRMRESQGENLKVHWKTYIIFRLP